ncbi:hypothetical protein AGLY_009963 [Aphis glycines]|uniref:Uncharacterized protein n=1 Tax=Aphis glycines TaxID=307491 RepID=A0A6G0TG82_APHGL|nr:hypothetical protein AGLY_009963 [Aphis glycines]
MTKIDRPTYDKRTKRTGCRLATGVGAALLIALVDDGGRHMRDDGWTEGWGQKSWTLDIPRNGHKIGAQQPIPNTVLQDFKFLQGSERMHRLRQKSFPATPDDVEDLHILLMANSQFILTLKNPSNNSKSSENVYFAPELHLDFSKTSVLAFPYLAAVKTDDILSMEDGFQTIVDYINQYPNLIMCLRSFYLIIFGDIGLKRWDLQQ